jgi:4-oxalocrotonate tautomerase
MRRRDSFEIRQERTMPHVLVKLVPGKSEEQKSRLAQEITHAVMSSLHCGEDAISVAFEEVAAQDWAETVCKPGIQLKWGSVYKKPGYNPFAK